MNHMQNSNLNEIQEFEKIYNATGYVIGNLWGGGLATYPATILRNFKSKRSIINRAKRMLKDGSLDAGMGYESLTGAFLRIEELKKIRYKKNIYENSDHTFKCIGELSDVDKDTLEVAYCNGYL